MSKVVFIFVEQLTYMFKNIDVQIATRTSNRDENMKNKNSGRLFNFCFLCLFGQFCVYIGISPLKLFFVKYIDDKT